MAKKELVQDLPFKIFNSLTARERPATTGMYEEPEGDSMTLPDQSYSVRELFERSGAGMTIMQQPAVYSDDDIPPLERMDFAERRYYLNELTQKLRDEKQQLDSRTLDLEKQEREADALRVKEERLALLRDLKELQEGLND